MIWTNRGVIALQSLLVSCLSDMHSRFYESSKLKKWMCELCTFSQIWSHILLKRTQKVKYIPILTLWMIGIHICTCVLNSNITCSALRSPALMQEDILQIVNSTLKGMPSPPAVLAATTVGKDWRRQQHCSKINLEKLLSTYSMFLYNS